MYRIATDADVDRAFAEDWASIVMKDGALDLQAVKYELFDYGNLLDEVPTVYMEITGGRISKPNTPAAAVLGVAAEREQEELEEAILPYRAALRGIIALWDVSAADRWTDDHQRAMERLVQVARGLL